MAKLTGPLLSFGARGQIGKALVVSKWRGVPYARQHVVPANPQTAGQTTTRDTFAHMRAMWKVATAELVAAWDRYALGRPFTGMNKFVGLNLAAMRGEVNSSLFIGSPGAAGGLPVVDVAPVTGGAAGEIDVTWTAPALPTGWTISKAVAVAFPQGDPADPFTGVISEVTDAAAPYDQTFTGLTAGATYVVSGWLVYTKPDGSLAYSASITATAAAGA